MADIFISYKKEDAGRVDRIVEGLRAEGFSVWWDHAIAPGSQWDQTIQTELNAAKMVIAVWSELSVNAPWVKEEASVGKSRGRLLPVRIDDVEPPLGFGLIQMADLIGWKGDRTDDPQWSHFLGAVKAVMSGAPAVGLEKPVRRKSRMPLIIGGGAAVAMIVAAVVGLQWLSGISGMTVDYGDGASTTITRTPAGASPEASAGAPAGAVPGGQPAEPSDTERAAYQKAADSKLKSDYLDYLRVYPQGAFAARIRDEVLPFCVAEQREKWIPGPTPIGQMLRGVSTMEDATGTSITYATSEAACASAKKNVEYDAERYCRGLTSSGSMRNGVMSMQWVDCACEQNAAGWFCMVDPTYNCAYEMKSAETVEICN
ncbi:TIR domain-containing protein [bacterium]|nr:TIR domain-containing protein [bacterium]